MSVSIHKEQATIKTASVDVKIIRLNRRQLTQSVFRQLDEVVVIGADGKLKGNVWGRVNYTWKENAVGTAFNVIWQDGDYLRRAPVPRLDHEDCYDSKFSDMASYDDDQESYSGSVEVFERASQHYTALLKKVTDRKLIVRVRDYMFDPKFWFTSGVVEALELMGWCLTRNRKDLPDGLIPSAFVKLLNWSNGHGGTDPDAQVTDQSMSWYKGGIEKYTLDCIDDMDELTMACEQEAIDMGKGYEARMDSYRESLRVLRACDQLFIAV